MCSLRHALYQYSLPQLRIQVQSICALDRKDFPKQIYWHIQKKDKNQRSRILITICCAQTPEVLPFFLLGLTHNAQFTEIKAQGLM